jgi:NADH:ubiquinone oxidoreductase subunit 3 (subunit A)
MDKWLLSPLAAFVVILFTLWLLTSLLSRLAFRSAKKEEANAESYACGEKNYDHTVAPDYSTFFSFAFFFTLAHVATLIMTFFPVETLGNLALPALYIIGVMLGLYILLRSD